MSEKPISPFTLTPSRIVILVLAILAVLMIAGSLMGGVSNFQLLRQSTLSSSSQAPGSAVNDGTTGDDQG